MSLLWRDHLRVTLAPREVAAVRIRHGVTPRVSEKHALPVTVDSSAEPWRPAVHALDELLSRLGRDPANVTVVLSNRFVRYAIAPWTDKLSGSKEELAFARHCLSQVYSDESSNWEIRLSPTAPRAPRLASAVDAALISVLKARFADRRLRVRSMQPYLMAAFNLCRIKLDAADCLFVLVESDLYTCARLVEGRWTSVHVQPAQGGVAEAVPVILDREESWGATPARTSVIVYAPREPAVALPAHRGWSIRSMLLQPRYGFSPTRDANFAMAMSAA